MVRLSASIHSRCWNTTLGTAAGWHGGEQVAAALRTAPVAAAARHEFVNVIFTFQQVNAALGCWIPVLDFQIIPFAWQPVLSADHLRPWW